MMAGKTSAWRKGANRTAYRGNDEFWASSEGKKQTACWKCNESWKCKNAYKSEKCLGLDCK